MFIKFKKLNKRFYDKVILKNVDLLVSGDRKIGLIGNNGSGKTTFLKIIAGIDKANAGVIEVSPPETTFAYIMSDQDLLSAYDYPYQFLLPETITDLYEEIFVNQTLDQEIYSKFEEEHGYTVLNEIEKQLNKFNIPFEDLTQTFNYLSSGERLKMQFAKIASNPYDALLLDEPTATLDVKGKEFLYSFLSKWHSFCMIASHDRKLLNEFCGQVLVFEEETIKSYSGNYDFFVKASTDEKLNLNEQNKIYERKIGDLTDESKSIVSEINAKEHIRKDNDKLSFNYKITRKHSKYSRKAEVLNHKVEKLKKNIIPISVEEEIEKLNIYFKPPKSKEPIIAKSVTIKIEDKLILEDASFIIKKSDRILIEGKNGIGKSSFIKAIYHGSNISSGEIIKNEDLQIGYFEQTLSSGMLFIKAEDFVLGGRESNEKSNMINYLLDFFEFPKTLLYKDLDSLSEGERAKLKLSKVLSYDPNFLILDEPTNFIDLRTLERVQELIVSTKIPIIIVSHDDEFNKSLNFNKVWRINDQKLEISDAI